MSSAESSAQPSGADAAGGGGGAASHSFALSSRAVKVSQPAVSYLGLFLAASQDMYDADTNADGCVVLAVAENRLAFPNLAPLIEESAQSFPHELAAYGDMTGMPRFKKAIATHMTKNFGGYSFTQESFAVAAGCGAIVDALAFCMCEDGEAFLLPTPYYPGFDNDLRARANAKIVPCVTEAPEFRVTSEALRRSYDAATAEGIKVRAVLLTNPSNPLGTCMVKSELEAVLDFASEVGVHVISDEIYAQGVYDKDQEFVSISSVCQDRGTRLGDSVHVVYGFSKDFAASGLRVGILYSENKALHTALGTLTYFCAVSQHTQHTLAGVLENEEALAEYFAKTTGGLRTQYDNLVRHLHAMNIEFIPSAAGLFTCINLRAFLDEDSWEGEARLHAKVFDSCKVLLTPGHDCKMPEPGWFRCCWAWVATDAVDEFARRFTEQFIASRE